MSSLIHGVGTNDVGRVYSTEDGDWVCPYYSRWHRMLKADAQLHGRMARSSERRVDTLVDERFWRLSWFKDWVDTQPCRNWQKLNFTNEILSNWGVWSPDTSCFVESATLALMSIVGRPKTRDQDLPAGVTRMGNKFKVRAFGRYQGLFDNLDDALQRVDHVRVHRLGRAIKREADPRVVAVLQREIDNIIGQEVSFL